jgi:hypothetical protein
MANSSTSKKGVGSRAKVLVFWSSGVALKQENQQIRDTTRARCWFS